MEKTERGFSILNFRDKNGEECSLQKSSMADQDCIWLGCSHIGIKKFIPYKGWEDIQLEQEPNGIHHVANNRMHLTQEIVRDLLPHLEKFAKTGEI